MSRVHTSAVIARLRSDELANRVYFDEVIPRRSDGGETITNYLRVRTNRGDITAARLAGPLGPIRQTFWLTGVGTTPSQAAWVLEQATDVLLNWIPVVAGWNCRRLVPAASQPVDMDPEVDGRFFGVDQWDLLAEPV